MAKYRKFYGIFTEFIGTLAAAMILPAFLIFAVISLLLRPLVTVLARVKRPDLAEITHGGVKFLLLSQLTKEEA